MRRPRMRQTGRDTALVIWALLVILCAVMAMRGGPGAADEELARGGGRGKPRDVPMERLLRRIQMGQLSDKPAMFSRPARAAPGQKQRERGVIPSIVDRLKNDRRSTERSPMKR